MSYKIKHDKEIYEFTFGKKQYTFREKKETVLSIVIRLSSKKQSYECPVRIIDKISLLPKEVKDYIYKCLDEYKNKDKQDRIKVKQETSDYYKKSVNEKTLKMIYNSNGLEGVKKYIKDWKNRCELNGTPDTTDYTFLINKITGGAYK